MARKSEGWTLRLDQRTKKYTVRFRHAGKRFNRSTGERDRAKAQARAEEIHREVTRPARRKEVKRSPGLLRLLALWVAMLRDEKSQAWSDECERYARSYFLTFFHDLRDMARDEAWDEYVVSRLRQVQRTTVSKEASAGRQFLDWCKAEGYIEATPVVRVPKNRKGKSGFRPQVQVLLSASQAEQVIRELPERTKRGKHPAHAFFTFMWQTGLRRNSVYLIRVEDYDPATQRLTLRDEADKARYGRLLPLAPAAAEALESVGRELGLIFGRMDLRATLKAAAKRAGLKDWAHLSYHDWRHSRLTLWGEQTTNTNAFMYLAGHKHLSTASRYLHPNLAAAEQLLGVNGTPCPDTSGHASAAPDDADEANAS